MLAAGLTCEVNSDLRYHLAVQEKWDSEKMKTQLLEYMCISQFSNADFRESFYRHNTARTAKRMRDYSGAKYN